MANVKTRSGVIRNVVGAPLSGKVATLKDEATDLAVGSTVNTDPDGRYTFSNLPENVRYRVEVAFGGGSAQMHVNSPISPDLDHAYVNNSLRSAPGATVAFGGPVSVGGLLSAAGGLGVTGASTLNGLVNIGGAVTINGNVTSTGVANVSYLQAANANIDAILSAAEIQVDNANVSYLNVGADANIPGTLTVSTIQAIDVVASGYIQAEGNVLAIGGGFFETGLQVGGGAWTVSAAGGMEAYAPAIFNYEVTINATLNANGPINANSRVLVDGGTGVALPEIACITDPDTGIAFSGGNMMHFCANGLEKGRIWNNGGLYQFALYTDQTYIAGQVMLGGTVAAVSVAGVVRALPVYNGAGATLGWIPIYGALN